MGLIFDIQKFCIHDGPGIRTTVFFKGCPLRCEWCHNPESKRAKKELIYNPHSCVGCGACAEVCSAEAHILTPMHTVDRSVCTACGKCADVCPTQALSIAGKEMSADEVMREVLRDRAFYETSGGGLTLSGGELFLQFDFALELLKSARENGLHTCVETCGFTEKEKLLRIAAFTDLFLYDWKCTDPALHKRYTGVGNHEILENLRALNDIGASVVLRCPIVPGVNDTEAHFDGIASLAETLPCITAVELEPYHALGTDKAVRLGAEVKRFPTPLPNEIEEWLEALRGKISVPVRRS